MGMIAWGRQARERAATVGLAAAVSIWSLGASAEEILGRPHAWEMGMQTPASPIAEEINRFHNVLVVIITLITLFVLALLIVVAVRFNEKTNPTPSKVTHNSLIEVAWTVLPVLILVGIAIPSFRLLRNQEILPENAQKERVADMTLKIVGNQWYWGVEYPDKDAGFKFDALLLEDKDRLKMIQDGKAKPEDVPHLLAVDNDIVVPVNKVVRLQITSADVIHSFSVPALGFRRDAVPGRLNETWFLADKEGVFYGQCSRLCGKNHAYMPIAIRAVSDAKYAEWLAGAKKKYASIDGRTAVAANTAPTE